MQKTGLKTFVYSFCVSLFAIFAANGIYLRMHPSNSQHIEIPRKNVLLFLKNEAHNPSLKPVPVKKIALSVLPEIVSIQSDGDIEAVHQPPIPTTEVIMADTFIPLESGNLFVENDIEDEIIVAADDFAPVEVVSQSIIAPEEKKIAAPVINESADKIAIPSKPQPSLVAKTEPLPIPLETEPSAETKPFVVAKAADPIPLLPLEKSADEGLNRQKINIGDPDKLNQVALADKNIPIRSMENDSATPPPAWQQMDAEKSDSPWVVARGAAPVKNALLQQEEYYKKEDVKIKSAIDLPQQENKENNVQVAADTIKNLLIPIPEDIMNEENIVPELSYPPIDTKDKAAASPPHTQITEEKSSILKSLNSIFGSGSKKIKSAGQNLKAADKSPVADKTLKQAPATKKITIMPTEMRLAFQPNRAEISGQTLRWIQAFAARAADDDGMTIEIRIDGTSGMELQQKRLNLLHNILTNKGVEYSKINTVFTSREPNSFIIKTVTRNFNKKGTNRNFNNNTGGHYMQW